MKQKSLGFKIGAVLAALHFCLVVLAFLAMVNSRSSTSGLVFIWFYFLDAPLLLLFPSSILKLFGVFAPLIQFGIFGSSLWFLVPWVTDLAVTRVFPRGTRIARVLVIVIAIPLLVAGFVRLSFFSVKHSIQQERPAELEKTLNNASTDFLTAKVIFEAPGQVSNINLMSCRPGVGVELLLSLSQGVVFLDSTYQTQHRVDFPGRRFWTIEPFKVDSTQACGFLAYRYMENVYLLDSEGKEIWKSVQADSQSGPVEGVRMGDVDGDGKPEFALYHSYRQGIELIDAEGRTRWKHPVYALGHLEIADVRGNGKAQVIYSNSNNANGITDFTFLNADGVVDKEFHLSTASSEFAMIKWPKKEALSNVLLTEDNTIRIVDLQGGTVMQLSAPGCRTWGAVKAVTIKFRKEEPEYLAVRKSLHPDLSVLYVYDPNGNLVYQKTEVSEVLAPLLFAAPVAETGTERLLVGSTQKFNGQVVEYSLTR